MSIVILKEFIKNIKKEKNNSYFSLFMLELYLE